MVSPQVWALLKNLPGGFTAAHKFEDGYVSIDVHAPFEPIRQRRLKPFLNDDIDDHFPLLEQRIKGYVPNSVRSCSFPSFTISLFNYLSVDLAHAGARELRG